MTWIKTVPYEQAGPEMRHVYEAIRALYPREYGGEPIPSLVRPDGTSDSIVAAHSLIPEALEHALSTHGVLLSEKLPLTRRQHEMIATVVSALNRCFY